MLHDASRGMQAMITAKKVGKNTYRIYEHRTASEKPVKADSVLVRMEDSKQSERLLRKVLKAVES